MSEKKIPFSVNRNDVRPLFNQVVDGFREAIISGYYEPGDKIPSSRDLCPILGVSRIVTQAALEQLVAEGLVVSRPRVGTVVRDRGEKQWRGNVLFVQRASGRTYYVNVFTAVLRARLVKAGWLFTQVSVTPSPGGKAGISELELHLKHPVSLAAVMFENPVAERVVARAGVPFVTLDNGTTCRRKGCVGHVRYNRAAAANELAEAAVASGVKTAWQVGMEDLDDVGAALKASGVTVSCRNVPVHPGKKPESVSFAARDAFAEWLGRCALPDLIYFSDDHACTGALAAFAARGVRVPEDVRIATWSNLGNGPVFAKELTRMEIDPEGDAEKFAAALLAHLEGRHDAFPFTLVPTFRKGATL